jgi:hypothetical protein
VRAAAAFLLLFSAAAAPNSFAEDWADGASVFARALEEVRSRAHDPVTIVRDAAGTLVIGGESCALLEKQVAALAQWKSRLGEPAPATVACRCSAGGCQASISSVAPDFVSRTHGTRAGRWGPNCWNTALVASKILEMSSFTAPEEMTYWMKSPLCRSLRAGEAPRAGDIIAIRDQSEQEVHAFIHLTDELSFSKNYLAAAAPFALQNPSDVFQEYPVPEECRKPGHPAASCPAHADYFRCVTMEAYLPFSGPPPSAEYVQIEAKVFEVERAVDRLVFNWERDAAFRGRADAILASAARALLPLRDVSRARTGLLWEALALRIDGILRQIELI